MRILIALAGAAVLAACSPTPREPTADPAQAEIESTTAPAVGGPGELPKNSGVTPAPEAVADASAEDVAAAASPAEAAALSGGDKKNQ